MARKIAHESNPWGITQEDCEEVYQIVMRYIRGEETDRKQASTVKDFAILHLRMVNHAQRSLKHSDLDGDNEATPLNSVQLGDAPIILHIKQSPQKTA